MKTLSIILTVIGLAAWMQQIAYADPSGENNVVPKEQPKIARRFNPGDYPHPDDQSTSSSSRQSQTLETSRKSAIAIAPRSGAVPVAEGFSPRISPHANDQRRVATPDTKRNLSRQVAPTAIDGPAAPTKSTVAITGQSAKATPGTAALNGNSLGRKH